MMLLVPLMCWEYRDTSLLKSVQPNHRATVSCTPSFIGSKYSLCIHPRALELFVKAGTWDPYPSCWIVIYIETAEVRNSRRLSGSTPFHLEGMYQLHAINFSLYLPISYLQASDHSVTVGVVALPPHTEVLI